MGHSEPRLDEKAVIENRGGAMRLDANLANLTLWKREAPPVPASLATIKIITELGKALPVRSDGAAPKAVDGVG